MRLSSCSTQGRSTAPGHTRIRESYLLLPLGGVVVGFEVPILRLASNRRTATRAVDVTLLGGDELTPGTVHLEILHELLRRFELTGLHRLDHLKDLGVPDRIPLDGPGLDHLDLAILVATKAIGILHV